MRKLTSLFIGVCLCTSVAANNVEQLDTTAASVEFHESVQFIDVRNSNEFDKERIEDSANLAYGDDFTENNLLSIVDKDQKFVIYCNDYKKALAAYKKAKAWGFEKVAIYTAGLSKWKQTGLPVE